MIRAPLTVVAALLVSVSAHAQQAPDTAPETIDVTAMSIAADPLSAAERAVPRQLGATQKQRYRQIFEHIAAGRLTVASNALAAMPRGLLHPTAEAQILLAQGANAGLTRLVSWLSANPQAPQAPQIAALARRAGATDLPPLANARQLLPVSLTPPLQPRSARRESAADSDFASRAQALIAAKNIADVAALVRAQGQSVSADVRSEWAYRAAWDAYLDLDDAQARRMAKLAASGSGEWAAMGYWVAGLAAFRQSDWADAEHQFEAIANVYTASPDLRSASAYWAARSAVRAGHPERSAPLLKAAMDRKPDGFYGLLAARTLGLEPGFSWAEPDFIQADWTTLHNAPGARRAAALVEIGESGLADRELRYLATTTGNEEYEPIMRLAARLNLPATQYWLAQNPPPGMMPPMAARFPTPDWQPIRGWRVDKSLVFAHALQESKFITTARSGPGAQGAMQIMPGTARDLARYLDIQVDASQLNDPAFNVEFGQTYLEQLRDSPHTAGLLPKVIAAYNAGPGSVQKWNAGALRDNGDVLLFIESIPFRETRHYVPVVLRNYWLYGLKAKAANTLSGARDTLTAVAANQWPRFPSVTPAK